MSEILSEKEIEELLNPPMKKILPREKKTIFYSRCRKSL